MSFSAFQALWSASIAVIPLAIIVAFLVTLMRCRPATRHALWVGVLLSLLTPLLLAIAGVSNPAGAFRSSVDTIGDHARTAVTTAGVATTVASLDSPRPRSEDADERPQAPRAVAANAQATTRQTPWREAPVIARRVEPQAPARRMTPPRSLVRFSEPASVAVPLNSDPLPAPPRFADAAVLQPPRFSRVDDAPIEPTTPRHIANHPAETPDAPPVDTPIAHTPDTLAAGTPTAIAQPEHIAQPERIAERRPQQTQGDAALNADATPAISAWITWMTGVRDAMVTLPPVPPVVWFVGVLLVLTGWLVRSGRSRHILRGATPASPETVELVQRESERIGLRRAPETLMVTAKISPSVLCDVRPRLAIPVDLWAQFDDASKRAAIVHELAHLRRRDHWVMWLETIVSAIYWWHPVVWWIRKRLREEADLCCDAWVTTLMPKERRAYAEALVLTKAYLSCPGPREHRVGIGMASAHAKKFARRVTMVMTQRGTPRMSGWGVALASAITLAGLIAAPTIACPPEKKQKVTKAEPVADAKPSRVVAAPPAPPAPVVQSAPRAFDVEPEGEAGSTFEQHMEGGDRIDDLERRIHRLEQRIDQLINVIERRSGVAPRPTNDGATSQQLYVLPEGKLAELTQLMVRQDVPILVSPRDDGLIVYATPSQHQAFSNFLTLIHPEHARNTQSIPQREDYAEAVARDHRNQILAQRNEARHEYEIARSQYQNQIQVMNAQARDLRDASDNHRRETNQLYREMERVLKQSEKCYDKAEHYYDKAENLHDEAEELMDEADQNDSDDLRVKAETLMARAHDYEAKADAYEHEGDALEAQAENLEDAADQVESQADEFEDQADEFEDRAEELEERLEELMEELEDLMRELEDRESANDEDDWEGN